MSCTLIFLKTVKEIWDTLKEVYHNEKDISRVFELYEFFSLSSRGDVCSCLYSVFRSILDKLEVHQPLITDLKTLTEYF